MVGKRDMAEDPDREYKALKHNNSNLARALTEERLLCKQYIDERNILQKKLNSAMIMNTRYETLFNQLSLLSKHALPNCISLTNNMSEIMQLCTEGINVPKIVNNNNNEINSPWSSRDKTVSPGLSNKTHAVKPMVSGHVILHPTINLWRLRDIDSDERRIIESESQSDDVNTSNETQSHNLSTNAENALLSDDELRTLLPGPAPIRNYTAECLVEDYHTEESSEYDMSQNETIHNNYQECLNSKTSRLNTVHELDEEYMNDDSENINVDSNLLREARILMNPLPLYNKSVSTRKKIIEKKIHYDPLEGPSTLLDDSGYFRECNNYVSKPRAVVKRMYVDSDSDTNSEDSSHENKRKYKERLVHKRKASVRKNNSSASFDFIDEDCQVKNSNKYKKKRNNDNKSTEMYDQPVVILTQLSEDFVTKQNENDINSTVGNVMKKDEFVQKRKATVRKNNSSMSSNFIDEDYQVKNSNKHKKKRINDNENTGTYNQPVVILTQLSKDFATKQNENDYNSTVSNEMKENEKDIVSAQNTKNEVDKQSQISSVRFDGGRSRRTGGRQNYKEPSLVSKLRRHT